MLAVGRAGDLDVTLVVGGDILALLGVELLESLLADRLGAVADVDALLGVEGVDADFARRALDAAVEGCDAGGLRQVADSSTIGRAVMTIARAAVAARR